MLLKTFKLHLSQRNVLGKTLFFHGGRVHLKDFQVELDVAATFFLSYFNLIS